MKITINNDGNITIVNGRIISGGCSSAESKKIDEIKRIRAEKISTIKIDSDLADVTVASNSTDNIEIHYYGEVYTKGNLRFNVTTSDDEINVSAKIKGNAFNSSLKLNVLIPQKLFKIISIKCQNGSTELGRNVEAEQLKIDSQNGNVESEGFFYEINAKSINGSVDIAINAKNDIEIFASSTNGNVNVELGNIGLCNISTSSINGSAKNRHNATGKYKATGNVSSINGSVRVR